MSLRRLAKQYDTVLLGSLPAELLSEGESMLPALQALFALNARARRDYAHLPSSRTCAIVAQVPGLRGYINKVAAWLAGQGYRIVGADSFPGRGESAGYTLGLVVRYPSDLTFDAAYAEVADAWNAIISGTWFERPERTG